MSESIDALIRFINETMSRTDKSNSTMNVVLVLWSMLFGLILTQKVFKYIVKPRIQQQQQQPQRDPSTECIIQ